MNTFGLDRAEPMRTENLRGIAGTRLDTLQGGFTGIPGFPPSAKDVRRAVGH